MFLWSLVIAQFLLAAALVLSASWNPLPIVPLALSAPGIGLAVWAWMAMGLRKIRIHPSTTESTRLITQGPYRLVRHPMYTGLLWFTVAFLFCPFRWWRLLAWFSLLAVLYLKSFHEEKSMRERFAEYQTYQNEVGRIFPKT